MFADQKMPNMYFVNANGFKTQKDITEKDLLKQFLPHITQEPPTNFPSEDRSQETIRAEFEKTYPQLMHDKGKPVLVFDTCIHSGDTLLPVKKVLQDLGFKDIRIGTIEDPPAKASVGTDFYLREEGDVPAGKCHPFGKEISVNKTYNQVHSSKSDDPKARERAQALRQEIKRIVEEKGKK